MVGIDIKPELKEMIEIIGNRNMYSGNNIPESILKLLIIEEKETSTGILAPYWLGVLEHGRGPRKNTTDHQLWKKIYYWMEKHNYFKSSKKETRIREAKFVTYYINKHGNRQFRNKTYIDIYNSVRKETIKKIEKKFAGSINKITMDII